MSSADPDDRPTPQPDPVAPPPPARAAHGLRRGQAAALVLVLAGALFGFVLATGLSTLPPGWADQEGGGPVTVPSVAGSLPDFADLAEAIRPAVVAIEAMRIEREPDRGGAPDPFDLFFGPRGDGGGDGSDGPGQAIPQASTGSGFLVSADGLIVTNTHVIEGADRVTVNLEGRDYDAEVKGIDAATDVALLKVDAGRPLSYLELGDSDALRVGEWVMVVGSPLQLDQTVTVGVVSAKGRSLGVLDSSFEDFIQTDAAINFGNSGGPLIDLEGRVVGIATLINWGAENIGFAVPVKTLQQILPQLRDLGEVRRGYLGVVVNNVTYQIADAFGLPEARGALVSQVVEGSPGADAGLRHGDIVVRVDGKEVADTRFLIDYVSGVGPGESVDLEVLREGEALELRVRLTERPGLDGAEQEAEPPEPSGSIDWLGIVYQDLTPGLRRNHGLPASLDGVWITNVRPTSPLYDDLGAAGVIAVLTEVNGTAVESAAAFEAAIEAAPRGSRMRLYIRRFFGGEEVQPLFSFPQKP